MKLTTGLTLLTLCLASSNTFGAAITNGDFSSCDYSGWSKDTDGFGDVSTGNDFSMVNNAGDCSAEINIDHFSTPGDVFSSPIDDAWFANSLSQELDLTAAVDSTFSLEIDFSVDSEVDSSNPDFFADYFLIGLSDGIDLFNGDGLLGSFYEADIDGFLNYSLTFEIANSFVNQSGWFLDFQLLTTIDGYGSSFILNSASLTEVESSEVPEPAALSLLSLGLLGMYIRKKRA